MRDVDGHLRQALRSSQPQPAAAARTSLGRPGRPVSVEAEIRRADESGVEEIFGLLGSRGLKVMVIGLLYSLNSHQTYE